MEDKPLKRLTLCIDNESKDEVSIIFADPSSKDLRNLIGDDCVLNLVRNLLWPNKQQDNSDHANEDNKQNVEIERDKDREKVIDQELSGLYKEEIIDDVCEGDLNEDEPFYNDEEDHIDKNPGFGDLNDDFLDSGEMEIDNDIPNCNGEGKIKAEIPTFESEDVKEADTINENDLVDLENLEETINPTIQVKSELLKNVNVRVERLNFLNVDHYIHNGLKLLNVNSHIQDGVFDVQDFILKIDNQIKSNKSTASDPNSINSGKIVLNSEITETENKLLDREQHTCDVCQKDYSVIGSLNSHMKKFHKKKYIEQQRKAWSIGKASNLTCDICDKVFTCRDSLKEHKIWHTGVKPFSCDICDKVFKRRANLNEHKIWHTGEKPFSCDICDKKYSIKKRLTQHKKIHIEGGEDFNADEPIDKGGEDIKGDEPINRSGEDLNADESINKGGEDLNADGPINKSGEDLNADEPINKGGEDIKADEPINKSGEDLNADIPSYESEEDLSDEDDPMYDVEKDLIEIENDLNYGKGFHVCNICKDIFSSIGFLKKHMKIAHDIKKYKDLKKKKSNKFSASDSNPKTSSKIVLNSEITKTDNKSLNRGVAEKRKNNLRKKDTDLKKKLQKSCGKFPTCDICKKSFTQRRYFNLHLIIHIRKATLKKT